MIQVQISLRGLTEFVRFLREEREKEIEWDFFLHRYRGQKSFDEWREEVKGRGG